MPLHPAALAWLETHAKGLPGSAFVLGDGTRPNGSEILRADLEAAGLPSTIDGENVTFHALRRTFASLLDAAEVPGELVDRMLGQAPPTTRGRHYARTDLARWHRAVCLIDLDRVGDAPSAPEPSEQPSDAQHETRPIVPAESSPEHSHESPNSSEAPVTTRKGVGKNRSHPWESDPRPAVYETAALPLS